MSGASAAVVGLRLRQRLSAGPDGVRYLASDAAARPLVVDRLETLRQRPARWSALKRRIALVTAIEHRAVVPLLQHDLDAPVPYLVSAARTCTLLSVLCGEAESSPSLVALRLRQWLTELAEAMVQAHRLGVIVGLRPSGLWCREDGGLWCDLSGVQTSAPVRHPFEEACQAPAGEVPSLASDVYALGALWRSLTDTLIGDALRGSDSTLLENMLQHESQRRPSIAEVHHQLVLGDDTCVYAHDAPVTDVAPGSSLAPTEPRLPPLEQLRSGSRVGRFVLKDLLGEGGMGRVFEAADVASGARVALKLLHTRCADDKLSLQRFYREARLLSQLDNPFIARFVEVNQDGPLHFLAMELVEGQSLHDVLQSQGRLDERQVLSVLCDMARALADVHDLGVVHRDIKTANVLLTEAGAGSIAKLCDFGIARQMGKPADVADRVTRLGTAVGTPQYMSPEQCVGGLVDARSDIYALGITAYEMLAGVLPFQAATVRQIVMMQLNDAPPPLLEKRPQLRRATVQLVERMLNKKPSERYPNARALLQAVEGVRRGAAERIQLRPAAPSGETSKVMAYDIELSLRSAPAQLWPYVSNTERLNRAVGIRAVDYHWQESVQGRELRGQMHTPGMAINWRESPFEWVAPQRMGVLREYDNGPLEWVRYTVQLNARPNGTLLRHRIEVLPRGLLGKAAVAVEIGLRMRRGLERVYRSIDDYVQTSQLAAGSTIGVTVVDPFESPPKLDAVQAGRLAAGRAALLGRGVDGEVAEALCNYLRLAPAQAVASIRPRVLAREYRLSARKMLEACFYGAKDGLLNMLWNVLCPRCRVPASMEESLGALKEHAHCEACALDYDVDFGRSIEVVFAAHPSIRKGEQRTYCIGGPANRPHVLAQVRLAAGARFAFDLALPEGNYQIAARELPTAWAFAVTAAAPLSQWEVPLRKGLPATLPRTLRSGRQQITVSNDYDNEVVVRIEQTSGQRDAVTATEAACSSLFRELFPGELLAPGLLLNTDDVALLQVALHDPWRHSDEVAVFVALNELVTTLAAEAQQEGGAVVKTLGDGVLATFPDMVAAAAAARRLLLGPSGGRYRAAVHGGAALVTSIDDRLDYFGRVLRDCQQLLASAEAGELVLSEHAQSLPAALAVVEQTVFGRRVVEAAEVVGLAVQLADTAPAAAAAPAIG